MLHQILKNFLLIFRKIQHVNYLIWNILIKSLFNSGLFRYDDQVNDLDFFNKLKFTTKGPNSLGGKNTQSIVPAARGLDPSYIGRIDLNVVGNSDPK